MSPRWNENLFALDKSYPNLVELWNKIAASLDENEKTSYYEAMRSWVKRRSSSSDLMDIASKLLPADQKHVHDDFVAHLAVLCQLGSGEENMDAYKDRAGTSSAYLPHVSDITARLILACLYHGLEFPCTDDAALQISSTVKTMISCRVESAIKVVRNFVVSESGMLRFKPLPPGNTCKVTLRDVADSLTLATPFERSKMREEVQHFASLSKFCETLLAQDNVQL